MAGPRAACRRGSLTSPGFAAKTHSTSGGLLPMPEIGSLLPNQPLSFDVTLSFASATNSCTFAGLLLLTIGAEAVDLVAGLFLRQSRPRRGR